MKFSNARLEKKISFEVKLKVALVTFPNTKQNNFFSFIIAKSRGSLVAIPLRYKGKKRQVRVIFLVKNSYDAKWKERSLPKACF